eukprot:scaffold19241_cov105-Isochrysis_galbana.AAC.4
MLSLSRRSSNSRCAYATGLGTAILRRHAFPAHDSPPPHDRRWPCARHPAGAGGVAPGRTCPESRVSPRVSHHAAPCARQAPRWGGGIIAPARRSAWAGYVPVTFSVGLPPPATARAGLAHAAGSTAPHPPQSGAPPRAHSAQGRGGSEPALGSGDVLFSRFR